MPDTQPYKRPVALAIFLIVAGIVGWLAAFALTIEKFVALTSPGTALTCDFSVVVQCTANLESWQGSLFGFPNPIIGLAAWIAPLVVGVALLAGARFARWFWILFNIGVLAAMVFVVWLISQSIFVLSTLCIYCMITWAVTIPLFLALSLFNLKTGNIPAPPRLRSVAGALLTWVPAISLGCYLVIAVLAQVRLDFLATL
ncbi:putative membrane protein [Conyzicola lurida]|uniref:Putative membrane protein n=1 Tax=Conyzicola lurida TaxID=1172621 RepID=A0A841AI47_9MICO|nr:putative membrane protein [Conyzicola lurida]